MKKQGSYPRDGVLVNGDSGNDIELFVVKGVKGCIVSNAHAELRQWHESNNFDSVFLVSSLAICFREELLSMTKIFNLTPDRISWSTCDPMPVLFEHDMIWECNICSAANEATSLVASSNATCGLQASQRGAGGIMEAIGHFHLLPAAA